MPAMRVAHRFAHAAFALALLSAAAACGDDGGFHRPPDGPPLPPDAAPDASPDAPVTLTITDGTTPVQGVVVVFQQPDSSLAARVSTDAQGKASARVRAGGFVTAINPFPVAQPTGVAEGDLRTFGGVAPGDNLVLRQPPGDPAIAITIIAPSDPAATFYRLWTTCGSQDLGNGGGSGSGSTVGSGAPGGTVTLYGCGAVADLVIETSDASGASLGALVLQNQALVNGMTLDLSSQTYTATTAATFSYTSLPAGIAMLEMSSVQLTANGPIYEVYGGTDVTAGAATVSLKRAAIPGAKAVTRTAFYNGGLGSHQVEDWGPVGPYTFTGANVLLHEFATRPEYNLETRAFTWTVLPGAAPDLAIARGYFYRPDGKGQQRWTWEIVVPYSGTAVAYPVLPGPDAKYNPVAATDSVDLDRVLTAKVPGGYDAIRATALSKDPREAITGATGRIVTEEVFGGGVEALRARCRRAAFTRPHGCG